MTSFMKAIAGVCPNDGNFTNQDLLDLNIVAGLCPRCGEELMDPKEAKELQK